MPIDTSIYQNIQAPRFNSPFEALGQIMQLRQQRDVREQQIQSQQALEEERRQKLQQAQQQQQNQNLLADAYRQSFDEASGKVDRNKLRASLVTAGLGSLVPDIDKGLDDAELAATKAREAKSSLHKSELEYFGTLAKHVVASEFNPMIVNAALTAAELEGHDVKTVAQLWQTQPDQFKAFVSNLANPKPPAAPYTLAPGGQRRGPNNELLADNPVTPTPSYQSKDVILDGKPAMVNFDSRTGKYFQGDQDVTQRVRPIPAAPKDERLVQIMRDGQPVWVKESEAVGQPAAQAARAVTGAERQALSFFNRAKDAVAALETPDQSGHTLEDKIASLGLVGQGQMGYEGPGSNFLKSPEMQQYRQAQRAFTEARLRKESGAAIPPHEYVNDEKTYFKVAGDSPEVVAQKQEKRAKVLEGLGYSAGKAYDEFYGEPFATPKNKTASRPQKPIPGIPGGLAEQQPDGRWIRVK